MTSIHVDVKSMHAHWIRPGTCILFVMRDSYCRSLFLPVETIHESNSGNTLTFVSKWPMVTSPLRASKFDIIAYQDAYPENRAE